MIGLGITNSPAYVSLRYLIIDSNLNFTVHACIAISRFQFVRGQHMEITKRMKSSAIFLFELLRTRHGICETRITVALLVAGAFGWLLKFL